jgi:hypothetical protein
VPTTLNFLTQSIEQDNTFASRLMNVAPRRFVIAGWTGRNTASVNHHIEELEALGVPRPTSVPLYYRAATQVLTQSTQIESLGDESSGEAEPALFFADGEWWLTVGSDHTDRKVEGYSVAVSKQMCAKPIATSAWRWSDIAARQDEIQLESRIYENGEWSVYQRGTLASIRPLESLRDGFFKAESASAGDFMFCGTLGAIPDAKGRGIRPAGFMQISLRDLAYSRSIVHRYCVATLPVVA